MELSTYSVRKGTVQAKPMTRGEYAFGIKGQSTIYGGNAEDAGYYILYDNGLTGWMPAEDFADNYAPANTWQERLRIEYDELQERIAKLDTFLSSDAGGNVGAEAREALEAQLGIMESLLAVLQIRLAESAPSEATNDDGQY